MFRAVDHIVVVVRDLEAAIAAYSGAGFTVVRGGRHNIGTHNALIAFTDGSYIELIAFLNPVPGHPWYSALQARGGLVDFCMQTDDLDADVGALRAAGAAIGDPSPMTRDRPDGYRLKWVLAIPQPPFNGQVPFLIRDETPRDERLPRERSHRNGVTGLRRITLAVESPGEASRYYARVLGRPAAPRRRPDLAASGAVFVVGPHEIELIAPGSEQSPLQQWLRQRGPSPYAATLRGGAGAANLGADEPLGAARIGVE
jgi:catechol 2,3-dioxygenase-like lactoylglutathione lyase family enzyme